MPTKSVLSFLVLIKIHYNISPFPYPPHNLSHDSLIPSQIQNSSLWRTHTWYRHTHTQPAEFVQCYLYMYGIWFLGWPLGNRQPIRGLIPEKMNSPAHSQHSLVGCSSLSKGRTHEISETMTENHHWWTAQKRGQKAYEDQNVHCESMSGNYWWAPLVTPQKYSC